jgi:hypothetical protein
VVAQHCRIGATDRVDADRVAAATAHRTSPTSRTTPGDLSFHGTDRSNRS